MKSSKVITANEFCNVCNRVYWGDAQRLGYGKWRHQECAPGSRNWVEAYELQRSRSEVSDFLAQHYHATHA